MNGILKTQAQYYNDTSTYTGEGGTETNKAVIEDVYDLVAWVNITTNQPETFAITTHKQYAVIVNDINFNEHETMKFGVTTAFLDMYFNGSGGDLDGLRHSILNCVVNTNSPTASTGIIARGTIHNTNFKNLVVIGARSNTQPVFNKITLNRCNFSIYMSTTGFRSVFGQGASGAGNGSVFNDCTFNVTGSVTENVIFYSLYLTANRCLFAFSDLHILSTSTNQLIQGTNTYFNSCGFIGLISQTGNTSTLSYWVGGNIANSYIAIRNTAISNYAGTGSGAYSSIHGTTTSYLRVTGILAIDNDLLGGSSSDTTNVKYMTTANMKNKTLMQGIGFVTI